MFEYVVSTTLSLHISETKKSTGQCIKLLLIHVNFWLTVKYGCCLFAVEIRSNISG